MGGRAYVRACSAEVADPNRRIAACRAVGSEAPVQHADLRFSESYSEGLRELSLIESAFYGLATCLFDQCHDGVQSRTKPPRIPMRL